MLEFEQGVTPLTGSVDSRTDVCCHGDVACGLSVRGRDVLIEGAAIRARVRARRDLTLLGGARGDFRGHCELRAGRNLRARFADKAYVHAHGRLDLAHSLHSHLLAGSLVLSGNLNGGQCHVHGQAFIGGNLGHPACTPTWLYIGQPPLVARALAACQQRLNKNSQEVKRLASFVPASADAPPSTFAPRYACLDALQRKLLLATRRVAALKKQERFLRDLLDSPSPDDTAELTVLGTVHPGVCLYFGTARLDVSAPLTGARFRHEDGMIRTIRL